MCNMSQLFKISPQSQTIILQIMPTINWALFHLSSTSSNVTIVSLFDYVIYSSVGSVPEPNIANETTLSIMVPERGNLTFLMAEIMVNTMILLLWRYFEYLPYMMYFSLERDLIIKYRSIGMCLQQNLS